MTAPDIAVMWPPHAMCGRAVGVLACHRHLNHAGRCIAPKGYFPRAGAR